MHLPDPSILHGMLERSTIIALALTLFLGACASLPPAPERQAVGSGRPADVSGTGLEITLYALGLIDTGYRFGGKNPEAGLDCSGMVSYIFDKAAGLELRGSAAEIAGFCQRNYGVDFVLAEKVDVNGSGAHPLFHHLTAALPGVLGSEAIKWNFTKFLVDRNGRPVSRHAPTTSPAALVRDIEALL